jgi:hypothetical protein
MISVVGEKKRKEEKRIVMAANSFSFSKNTNKRGFKNVGFPCVSQTL